MWPSPPGHLPIGVDGIPARLFLHHPFMETETLGLASHNADILGTAPQLLSQRQDALSGTLMDLVKDLRTAAAELLAQGGGDGWKFCRYFFHRMRQAVTNRRLGKERPHAVDRAFKASRENPSYPILWIGLSSRLTEGRHQAVATERTDQPIHRHRRDIVQDGTEFQAQPTMRGEEDVPGHVGSHGPVAQDKMGQHGEDRLAYRTLQAPDRDPAESDTHIVRVACQTKAARTRGFMPELEASGQDESNNKVEKGFALVQQTKVGSLVVKIDNNGALLSDTRGRRLLHSEFPARQPLPGPFCKTTRDLPPCLGNSVTVRLRQREYVAYAVSAIWHRAEGAFSSIVVDSS
jgi:hypothetical protein